MKEWLGVITVFVLVMLLAIGFVKFGLPFIERSMSAVTTHKASI